MSKLFLREGGPRHKGRWNLFQGNVLCHSFASFDEAKSNLRECGITEIEIREMPQRHNRVGGKSK